MHWTNASSKWIMSLHTCELSERRQRVTKWHLSTSSIRIILKHLSRQKYRWNFKVTIFITRPLHSTHTDLQSSIARWALRALSVLSRRSGSRSGDLPMWKMLAADLGRFFRPFGAEHMHTRPRVKPPRRENLYSPFGRVRSILDGSFLSCRRWDRASATLPLHLLHDSRVTFTPVEGRAPQKPRSWGALIYFVKTNYKWTGIKNIDTHLVNL